MLIFFNQEWDLIVAGTGMSGRALGRALVEMGWSVVFFEKGRRGLRPELQDLNPLVSDPSVKKRFRPRLRLN